MLHTLLTWTNSHSYRDQKSMCSGDSHSVAKLDRKGPLSQLSIHISHTNHMVLDLLYVLKEIIPCYVGQEEKKKTKQFVFVTYLWPWNKAKLIKAGMTQKIPDDVIIIQNLKDPNWHEPKDPNWYEPKDQNWHIYDSADLMDNPFNQIRTSNFKNQHTRELISIWKT